jgi:hypothetical protein
VMIAVCDNTDIDELVYQKISGETQVELVTQADIDDEDEEEAPAKGKKKPKVKWITSYRPSAIRPELANTEDRKHTIRIDTKLLAEAESGDPRKGKKDFAEELRQVLASVGNPGQPGEHAEQFELPLLKGWRYLVNPRISRTTARWRLDRLFYRGRIRSAEQERAELVRCAGHAHHQSCLVPGSAGPQGNRDRWQTRRPRDPRRRSRRGPEKLLARTKRGPFGRRAVAAIELSSRCTNAPNFRLAAPLPATR